LRKGEGKMNGLFYRDIQEVIEAKFEEAEANTRFNGVHLKDGLHAYYIVPTKYAFTFYITTNDIDMFNQLVDMGYDVKSTNKCALRISGLGMNHIVEIIAKLEEVLH